MRLVEWTDRRGWRHHAWIRDDDPDEAAPYGVPRDPPDVEQLEWEEIKRDLHHALLDRGLISWQDVQRQQNAVTSALRAVLLKRIIALYRG